MAFARHAYRLTQAQILDHVWGYDSWPESNLVAVYVTYLRRKFKQLKVPVEIKSIRGVGYLADSHDVERIVLRSDTGTPVTVGDVAKVVISHTPRRGDVGYNNKLEAIEGYTDILRPILRREPLEQPNDNQRVGLP